TAAIRLAVIVTFVLFHIVGLGMCIELGLFPHTCVVGWLALTPGQFWDALNRRWRVSRSSARAVDRGTWVHAMRAPCAETIPDSEAPADDVGLPLNMNVLAGFFLVYVLLWNIRTLDYQKYHRFLPAKLDWIGHTFKLNQCWDMFAPFPSKEGGWHVMRGTLRDGTEVDLWRGGAPIRLEEPELVSAIYRNSRWRKYLTNLNYEEYARYRENFARWLCRDWNARHVEARRLAEVEIDYMRKVTRLDHDAAAPEKVLIIKHSCLDTCTGGGSGD
ncbi:MAG TPA: hypothetical protein VHS97_00445, partial [Isosphaeraceae bacterium]|nr:hypothetical protein [Isosphaeraceae bacterium]